MYPGNHRDTQFFPFSDCFAKPENEAVLAVKSGERSERFIYNKKKNPPYIFLNDFFVKANYILAFVVWWI